MPKHPVYDEDGTFQGLAAPGEPIVPADEAQVGSQDTRTVTGHYDKMKKAELHEELDSRGIEYDQSLTNPELVQLLEADDNDQATGSPDE